MIRVDKRANEPPSLRRGQALTIRDKHAFDSNQGEYLSGRVKFVFEDGVYNSDSVKEAVIEDQHGKCCFCEGLFQAHVAGDVEHFRPKGAVIIQGKRRYPGYYWLVYSWNNLYFACPDCNQYRKKDKFPLEDESTRVRSHHEPLEQEHPLLIDPGGPSDPRLHIKFDDDWPIGLTAQGREMIRSLKLDREALNAKRRRHLKAIRLLRDAIPHLERQVGAEALVLEARAELAAAVTASAEFCGATQDFLAGWHRPATIPLRPAPRQTGRRMEQRRPG